MSASRAMTVASRAMMVSSRGFFVASRRDFAPSRAMMVPTRLDLRSTRAHHDRKSRARVAKWRDLRWGECRHLANSSRPRSQESVVASMRFDWDDTKAAVNHAKHGVSFDEAETVFLDALARIEEDPDHSVAEQRYLIWGLSALHRLLLVSFSERGETIRIISARRASREERQRYEEDTP